MLKILRLPTLNQVISLVILISFLNLIQGCYYYKVTKSKAPPDQSIVKLQGDKKFIILHKGSDVWRISNIIVKSDTVKGQLSALEDHQKFKTTNPETVNRYKKNEKKNESEVLNEVHIYTTDLTPEVNSQVTFPLKSIKKIEIYDPAIGATVASWVFSGLGIVIPVFFVVVILVKESCPFIYVSDNGSYRFVGEIYSGAIYPSVERDDYIPLPDPMKGQTDYNIKMTNEVHEIQHTNLIELNVFDHPNGTNVLVDKYGKYHTTSNLQTPVEATNLKKENILKVIKEKDTLSYCGDELGKDPALLDGIILKFQRPPNVNKAKLVVKAKSTFWLDYVFTRFHELFGKEYECWVDEQKKIPEKKMKSWMLEQNIPMSLYIEKGGHWKFVDYYNIVGPMAAKEDILSIDISDIKTDTLSLKLEYGFLFWEVDYAAIDYTDNVQVKQRIAYMESAIDNNQEDVKNLMESSDTLYYVQPEIGDEVNIKFSVPEPSDSERTMILHSRGYYKIIMNLTGEQQTKYLLPFRKKGHFPLFSSELLKQQTVSDYK